MQSAVTDKSTWLAENRRGQRCPRLPECCSGSRRADQASAQFTQRSAYQRAGRFLGGVEFVGHLGKRVPIGVAAEQPPARRRTPIQESRARRNYVLLRLLYAAGLRVDEIAHLAWRDLRERG